MALHSTPLHVLLLPAGSTCLPEGAGWGGVSKSFASHSTPAQGQSPQTHQHPVLCREVHRDAWAPHLLKGQEDNQTHTLTFCAQQGPQRFPFHSSSLLLGSWEDLLYV